MGVIFNDNGVLRDIEEIPINVAGNLHDVHLVQYNDGGTLRTVWLNPNAIQRVEVSVERYAYANYFGDTSKPAGNATTTIGSNYVSFSPNNSGSVFLLYFKFFDKYGNSAPLGSALLPSLNLRCSYNVYISGRGYDTWHLVWFQSPQESLNLTGSFPVNHNGTHYWVRGSVAEDASVGCVSLSGSYSTMNFTINSLDLVDKSAPTVSLKSIPFTILPFVDKEI